MKKINAFPIIIGVITGIFIYWVLHPTYTPISQIKSSSQERIITISTLCSLDFTKKQNLDIAQELLSSKDIDTTLWGICVVEQASANGVPPEVPLSIITLESNWKPKAYNKNRNGTFDVGLFQINSSNFEEFDTKYWGKFGWTGFDPYNPYCNIFVSIKHMKHLFEKYHDWSMVIRAWNGGAYNPFLTSSRAINDYFNAVKRIQTEKYSKTVKVED